MQALEAITFDTNDWSFEPRIVDPLADKRGSAGPSLKGWMNDDGDTLTVHFFQIPPDLPTPLHSVEELRDFHRPRVAENGGGIVEIDVGTERAMFFQRTIYKFPQKPSGMTYVGALTFPFAQFSYMLKVQCPEAQPTGVRESMIGGEVLAKMDKGIDPKTFLKGWARDPYRPDWVGGALRTEADDEKYDARFPAHPLTRCRKHLAQLQRSVQINSALLKVAKPFPRAEGARH